MARDPIVEEIHEIRRKMLEECGGDFDKFFDRLMAAQKKRKRRLVSGTPRPKRHVIAAK